MTHTSHHPQQGIALVSSLLLLLAITLVGVTSLRMNLSSEEMASNSYLRDQALQAAQLGLEYGEIYVRAQPSLIEGAIFRNNGTIDNNLDEANDGDNCNNGLCIPINFIDNPPNNRNGQWVRGNGDVWSNNNNHLEVPEEIVNTFFDSGSGQNPLPPFPPRFIIEFMGHTQGVENGEQIASTCDTSNDGNIDVGRTTYPFCLTDPRTFRVTALGTAGSATNPVEIILQSTVITP